MSEFKYGLPNKWNEETDVAVIGSGFAGLMAAIEAARNGSKVVILEKMPHYGGNSIISGGGCASYDSKLQLRQKLDLGEDSWQQHMEDTIKGGGGKSDPKLVEVMTKNAPKAIDQFVDIGVKFKDTLPRMGGHYANRCHLTVENKGLVMIEPLLKEAQDSGAELRLNTAVTRIWRENEKSPVTGLELNSNGITVQLRIRKALVMASGGFAQDVELRTSINPNLTAAYNCSNHKGATGECIRFAQAIGADVTQMDYIQLFPTANPVNGGLDKPALDAYSSTGYGSINVDKDGCRFVNELGGRDEVADAQILGGKEKPTYTIMSKAIYDALAVTQDIIDAGVKSGRIIAADSIEELAAKLNMPKLVETVNNHNRYLADGKDPEFNKAVSDQMIPFTVGPFYGIAQWPTIHFCMGGLKFDTDAHVVDLNGNIIPRFYAAGECCGGVHGANRLAGNAIAECMVFGSIAGCNAAAEENQ